MFGVRCLRA